PKLVSGRMSRLLEILLRPYLRHEVFRVSWLFRQEKKPAVLEHCRSRRCACPLDSSKLSNAGAFAPARTLRHFPRLRSSNALGRKACAGGDWQAALPRSL